MLSSLFFRLFLTFLVFSSCVLAKDINLAIASNLNYVIEDLKKEFLKHNTNISIKIISGSSSKLSTQIINGAPFDIFMSADIKFPNILYEKNLTISKPIIYANGSLSFFSHKKQNFSKNINLLKEDHVKTIAIPNPKTAPYGKAILQALKNAGIYDDIKKKLIYGESVSQTFFYAQNTVDLAIVASSVLYSKQMSSYKKNINYKNLNKRLYSPIKQGVVLLKNADKNTKKLFDFLLSKSAKKIFLQYGYTVE